MSILRKPKPFPKPTIPPKPIRRARTTKELLKRLEEEEKKRKKQRKKKGS